MWSMLGIISRRSFQNLRFTKVTRRNLELIGTAELIPPGWIDLESRLENWAEFQF